MQLFINRSDLAAPYVYNDVCHSGDILVMRHDDYRLAIFSCHFQEKLEHYYACFGIESACRLIAEQDLWILSQRPADRDSLLLTAGLLRGKCFPERSA